MSGLGQKSNESSGASPASRVQCLHWSSIGIGYEVGPLMGVDLMIHKT